MLMSMVRSGLAILWVLWGIVAFLLTFGWVLVIDSFRRKP